MHDLTHHLMTNVLPEAPVRQWVLAPPFELAPLLAVRSEVLSFLIRTFVSAVSEQMKQAASNPSAAHTGAIVVVQRFTKTLSLFPHLHVIFLDGVYVEQEDGEVVFEEIVPPSEHDLLQIAKVVFQKTEKFLQKKGFLEEPQEDELSDQDKWWLRATKEPSMLRAGPPEARRQAHGVKFGGFSMHAGVRIKAKNREGREKLVAYASRPPFCENQLRVIDDERVRLHLRSKTKAGQTFVDFHPVQLLRRLAWLIPPPRKNATRYYGVFAPTHKLRKKVVPRKVELTVITGSDAAAPAPYRAQWAALLKRVYDVDSQLCPTCGEKLRPIGAVERHEDAKLLLERGLSVLNPNATGPPHAA